MNFKNLTLITLLLGSSLAADPFFGSVKRAKLFEETDFKVPKLTINLSDEDYNRYFLTYKCEYDMNIRHPVRNNDCYNAPWVDFDKAIDRAFRYDLIDKSKIDKNDLNIINNKNITITQFENIITKYTNYSLETILSTSYGLITIPKYETEDASLTLDIDGEVHEAPSIKFAIGGRSTVKYEKLGFNIKIKKGNLLGRKQLRIRTEVADPTFMRSKLLYDMFNILEIPCLSLNYVKLYFNDRFMGFYAMRDAYKSSWIESTFNEKKTNHLYECDANYGSSHTYNCINDDEDIRDSDVDFGNFLTQIDQTKTKEELAEFFDVETYLKWQAIRYLIGGWDHATSAQNQYLYRYHNTTVGKDIWIPLIYDFDNDFGGYGGTESSDSFDQAVFKYERKNPIYKILGINENASPEVISYMDQIMRSYFNPKALFERIEQLRAFLDPYVKEDRAFDAEGNRPGRVPRVFTRLKDYYSYEDFQDNIEYTNIDLVIYKGGTEIEHKKVYGLKRWIVEKFRNACKTFDLDCSYAKEYLDDFEYTPVDISREEKHDGCNNADYECCVLPHTEVAAVDGTGKWGIEFNIWCVFDEKNNNQVNDENCWSLSEGYPCCKNKNTVVRYVSQSRGVKYGVENGDWCGIIEDTVVSTTITSTITTTSATTTTANTTTITITTTAINAPTSTQECWSLSEGYPCCQDKNAEVRYVSKSRGVKYGVENGDWCGIIEN